MVKKMSRLCLVTLLIVLLAVPTSAFAKVKITYWHQWTGQWTKVLNDIADMFNKAQNEIEVEAVCVPENFREKLMTAVASGDVPDVVSLTGDGNLYMAEKGLFYAIDELMSPKEFQAFKDWAMPVVWEVNEWKGHVWALTPYIDVGSLYYNKKHFQEVGFNPNKPPLDIETLDKYAEKLTKYDVRGNIDRIGFYPSWGLDFWANVFGGNLVDEDGAPIFNKDPKVLKALEWITSYSKKYDVKKIVAFESGLSGKVAIVTGGSRGIGRAIVELLASQGAVVNFFYRGNEAAANEVVACVQATGGQVTAIQVDVSDSAACAAAVEAIGDRC